MTIVNIITAIGIPAIVAALIYIGRKLQVLDVVEKKLDILEKKFENMYERFIKIEDRVNIIWKDEVAPAHSPRQLNDRGQKILNQSGIKEIIESKRTDILSKVKELNPTNAYDADQAIISVVEDLPKYYPDLVPTLKDGAFRMGENIDALLYVGSVYLRDLIFPDLGFSLTGLDKETD